MKREKTTTCGIVGLGYVGLTLAIHFDRAGYDVVGYDVDEEKIATLRRGRDVTGEFGDESIAAARIGFTTAPERLGSCEYVFVALPTPLDDERTPDLSVLEAACETVGRHISEDTVVVVESTVYPGATREVLEPAIERGTGTRETAFSVAYSPERIVPGGGTQFRDATKLVSAEDEATLEALANLYESVLEGRAHRVEDIETAEASKCLENVQRDVNIALVNEFTMACRTLDVDPDPHDVLAAARTKWNFHDYRPGIVGGHCIPVDPHYLRYAFEQSGYAPRLLRTARTVNQRMISHVSALVVSALADARGAERITHGPDATAGDGGTIRHSRENVAESRVLLLGFGYKPDVADVRNSGVVEIAEDLSDQRLRICGYDPFHGPDTVPDSFTFEVLSELRFEDVDAVVYLTPHDSLGDLDLAAVADEMNDDPVLVDVEAAVDPTEAESHGFTYRRV